jgi:pyruvate-formate lyase
LAGEPFSRNMVPNAGMDRGGITAYMQSVLKIDSSAFLDGVPFDFILHPSSSSSFKHKLSEYQMRCQSRQGATAAPYRQ